MKRWMYMFLPIILLGSLVTWRVAEKKAADSAQDAQRGARMKAAPAVSVAPAQIRDIVQTFEATGSVEAPLNVKISPKVTGRIDYLNLHEGDPVKKGRVLVRIDPSEIEAEVRQQQAAVAEAQYRLAQAQLTENPTNVSVLTQIRQQKAGASSAAADYKQVRENYQAQIAAASANVNDAQSRVDNARAAINSAQANLDNAKTKYNRMLGLYNKGFIAAQDVDDAKATVAVQQANLEVAQGQLKSATAQKQAAEQQASIVRTKGTADIEASRARMVQAQASVDYANANSAQTAAYKQSISALKATVDAAKASLAGAISKRSDTVLVSPLDGYVTGRYADPGSIAAPGQAILAVQFMRQVWVTIAVPEEITTKLHIGRPARIKLDAYPGRSFTGSIIQINPAADPQSRQFTVRVIMDNSQKLFRPGMFAHVSLETGRVPRTVAVPREAVQQGDMGSFAYVVDSMNKIHRQPVTTRSSDADWIAVEGLNAGDKVVTMSGVPLKDGQKISTGHHRR